MGLFIYSVIQMRLQNSLLRTSPCDDAPSFVMRWLHFLLPANRHWKSGNTSLPKVLENWTCMRLSTASFGLTNSGDSLLKKSSRSVGLNRPGIHHISFIPLSRRSQFKLFWEPQSSMIVRNSWMVNTISYSSESRSWSGLIWTFIAILLFLDWI